MSFIFMFFLIRKLSHSCGSWQSKSPGKQEFLDTSPTQVCILKFAPKKTLGFFFSFYYE